MAVNLSRKYVASSRRNLPWLLRLRIRLAPWIMRWSLLCLQLGTKKVRESRTRPQITSRLETAAAHFQKNT